VYVSKKLRLHYRCLEDERVAQYMFAGERIAQCMFVRGREASTVCVWKRLRWYYSVGL
jgi:hypothetical protein